MMLITGQTNVVSQRFGAGCVQGLGEELGRFIVVTMDLPWQLTRARLGGQPTAVVMVESMVESMEESIEEDRPEDHAFRIA